MPNKLQPAFPEPDTQEYWDAAKEGRLVYQHCNDCSSVIFEPRAHCPTCGSLDIATKDSAGNGTVYTYSVIRMNRSPAFADLGPYAVALVDLDEGFRMLTNIVGIDDPTQDVEIGMRVQVEFEEQDSGEYLIPVFRPA